LKTATPPAAISAALDAPAPRQALSAWTAFWFTPVHPMALCRLRFLAGLLFIAWLLPLTGQVEAFFGHNGWFDGTAYEQARSLPNSEFGWSLFDRIGGNATLVKATYWAALGVFLLFALGVCVRVTALLSWIMAVSFLASPAAAYDADSLVALIAFYMLVGHLLLGQWSRTNSPGERILGPNDVGILAWFRDSRSAREATPSYAANLAMRLLQVHFAIVVVVSGLHKLQSGDWWSGWAYWFPLHPPFETTQADIQAEVASGSVDFRYFALSLAEYLMLAWQIGFPFFAWKKSWRMVLLGGAVVGWLGCIFLYKLPIFGPVYMLGCLSFLSPEEWAGLQGVWGRLTRRASVAEEKRVRFQPRIR
jgi:hypothetical protein